MLANAIRSKRRLRQLTVRGGTMILLKACVLYIVSGTSVGWVSDDCQFVEEENIAILEPSVIVRVDELPKSQKLYLVEDTYVEYWTTPSLRVSFGTFFGYHSHHTHRRHRIRAHRRHYHTRRSVAHRRHHKKRIKRGRRVSPTRRVSSSPRSVRVRHPHRRSVRKVRKTKKVRRGTTKRRSTRGKTRRVRRRN